MSRARIRGCLLGGAAGDALGAAVEFASLADIRRRFGAKGIRSYARSYGAAGCITDDTQMTLFTAEGLLRAWVRSQQHGGADVEAMVHHAYLRWLLTQRLKPHAALPIATDGWLFAVAALHARRAPGNTCLAALTNATGIGAPKTADNDSKGCGTVMRVAPVGLFAAEDQTFALGAGVSALTHGHPSGYLAAGHLAVTIGGLLRGGGLPAALDAADAELRRHAGHAETAVALAKARRLAARGRPTAEAIETLGGGWVAEEALAIAICCALAAEDFADGIRLAANHSGDSDSTAAIAGNLLGALLGEAAIGHEWLETLELRAEIGQIADDLHAATTKGVTADTLESRYPGW